MKALDTLQTTIDSLTDEARRRTDDLDSGTPSPAFGLAASDDAEPDAATTDGADDSKTDRESVDDGPTDGSGTPSSDDGRTPSSDGSRTQPSGASDEGDAETVDGTWRVVDTDVEKTMYDVTRTANGVYAVGDSGTVASRGADGEWTVAIPSGPAVKRNTLTAVDVTDDGERIWFAGSSGAIGMYDTTTGRKYDHSAPMEMTSTWEAIGIAGERGDEHLFVANGSGEVLEATVDEDGCPEFGDPVKPGSGSTIPALTVRGDVTYAVDTSGNVFERRDGEWATVGIDNAQINFTDVNVGPDGSVLVTGGGGIVYRYDATCGNWTPVAVGTVVLRGIDRCDDRLAVVGDGGHAYERMPREGWTGVETGVEATLHAIALGETDVAVGEGGVIVEREAGDGPGAATDERDDAAADERADAAADDRVDADGGVAAGPPRADGDPGGDS